MNEEKKKESKKNPKKTLEKAVKQWKTQLSAFPPARSGASSSPVCRVDVIIVRSLVVASQLSFRMSVTIRQQLASASYDTVITCCT
jgi:hypothetical protein